MRRCSAAWAVAVIGLLLMQGCSTFDSVTRLLSSKPVLKRVSIEAAENVNGGYPIALDVVQVTDEQVYAQLRNLKASEWFSGKQDYLRQHRQSLSVMGWELVPGQQFSNVPVAENKAAVGALVFAGYLGARSYRSSVQGVKQVWIRLNDEDFELKAE